MSCRRSGSMKRGLSTLSTTLGCHHSIHSQPIYQTSRIACKESVLEQQYLPGQKIVPMTQYTIPWALMSIPAPRCARQVCTSQPSTFIQTRQISLIYCAPHAQASHLADPARENIPTGHICFFNAGSTIMTISSHPLPKPQPTSFTPTYLHLLLRM